MSVCAFLGVHVHGHGPACTPCPNVCCGAALQDEVDGLAASRGGGGEDPIGRRLLNELLVQMSSLAAGAAGAAEQGQRATPGGAGAARAAEGRAGGSRTSPEGDGVCRVYVFAATNRMQVGWAAQRVRVALGSSHMCAGFTKPAMHPENAAGH